MCLAAGMDDYSQQADPAGGARGRAGRRSRAGGRRRRDGGRAMAETLDAAVLAELLRGRRRRPGVRRRASSTPTSPRRPGYPRGDRDGARGGRRRGARASRPTPSRATAATSARCALAEIARSLEEQARRGRHDGAGDDAAAARAELDRAAAALATARAARWVADASSRSGRGEAPGGRAPAPGRVLVVDDSRINRQTLVAPARRASGTRSIEAEDGREALDLLGDDGAGIDVVLLDLVMPELDGFAVLAAIRRPTRRSRRIPVIVVSRASTTSTGSSAASRWAPPTTCPRPIKPTLLRARVGDVARRQAPARRQRPAPRDGRAPARGAVAVPVAAGRRARVDARRASSCSPATGGR